jgi:hypothetical protein
MFEPIGMPSNNVEGPVSLYLKDSTIIVLHDHLLSLSTKTSFLYTINQGINWYNIEPPLPIYYNPCDFYIDNGTINTWGYAGSGRVQIGNFK